MPPVLLTTAGYFVRKKLLGEKSTGGDTAVSENGEMINTGDAAIDIPEQQDQAHFNTEL